MRYFNSSFGGYESKATRNTGDNSKLEIEATGLPKLKFSIIQSDYTLQSAANSRVCA